ncbi:MAG: translocation/assembly module TamB domain-containing protein [Polyangiales bacterium]
MSDTPTEPEASTTEEQRTEAPAPEGEPASDSSERASVATGPRDSSPSDAKQKRRKRRARRTVVSFFLLVIVAVVALVARTEWAARKTIATIAQQVRNATGLELSIGRAGWSWRRLAIHAESVEVRHPTEGLLARVEWADLRPSLRSLLRGAPQISAVEVDGGEVRVVFKNGRLANGPVVKPGPPPPPGPPQLPFRDIAVSDVRIRVEHDQVGTITLESVDLDLRNENNQRLLVGLLSRGGSLSSPITSQHTGQRCFEGPIRRIEARAELRNFNVLRVGAAHIEALDAEAHVSDALVPLNFREAIRASVRARVPLSVATCPLPRTAPLLRGEVSVEASATVDPAARSAEVRGHANAHGVTITLVDPRPLGRNGTFGGGQSVEIDFHGTHQALIVDRLEARYGGGRVFSPSPRRPDRPLVFSLAPTIRLDGFFETQGLRFEQLMREVSVTDFAKVLWSIDALAEITLIPERFGQPPDRARPGMHLDIDADTRDFAIVKDFHRWGPPHEPIIAIPRGRVGLELDLDSLFVRFSNMHADFGHTHIDGDEVEVRTVHDPSRPDMVVRNIRSSSIDLSDVGHVAGIPIAGHAEAVVNGGGPFSDIIVTGTTRIRNYEFAGLPIGDVETAPGKPWQLRGITLRGPELIVRQGRSVFNAHDAILDFSRYTLVAAARVESSDAQLADYYHMFEFEGDPVFEPYTGGTMQDCSLASHDRSLPRSECWVSDTARPRTRRGDERPTNARARHGFVRADVEYVLGRPGDDPKGVLHADVHGWDLAVHAFGETVQHADLHATYDWLIRNRGFRGSRLGIEYARGRVANGTVEAGGSVDLGGRMHITGSVRGADLGRLSLTEGMNLRGIVDGTGVLEGTSESQRWSIDADVRDLSAAQREFGGVRLRLRSTPDPTGRPTQEAVNERLAHSSEHRANVPPAPLPDPQRWSLVADAVNGSMRIDGSLLVPFIQEPWRDANGAWQRDFSRSWRDAVMQGSIEASNPNASGASAAIDLLPWLPARLVARLGDAPLARAALRIHLDELSLRSPMNARGRVALDALDLRAMGVRVALPTNAPLAVCANDGRLWIDPAAARSNEPCAQPPRGLFTRGTQTIATALPVAPVLGPDGVTLALAGGATTAGTLALSVSGEADLAQLARRFPALVQDARGTAHFRVAVGGDTDSPELRGLVELDSGSLRASALPQPVDDLDLTIRLEGTQVALERARARFGSSSVDLSGGTVRFRGRDLERVDVPLVVRNLALSPSNGIEIALDADTRLSFAEGEPLPNFTGVVTLNRARYTRPIDMALISENGSGSAPTPEEPYDPSRDRVQLALELRSREPVRIRNNLVDADVTLSPTTPFRIVGTDQRPSVLGLLSIPRGRVFFRGNEFEVRRSRIEFDNPERISPTFDVLATTDIRRSSESAGARNQWRIDLHAYGTSDRFALDMSAEPALSREDIALMLAFRMTRAELDQLGANDFGQILAVEALSNLTGIDRIVRRNVPIISDFNITSGYSPALGRTVPQVSVRVPIATGVRAGATVNLTEQREVRGTIDAEINRNNSIQAGIDNYGQTGSQNRSGAVNLGVDWRFRLEFE